MLISSYVETKTKIAIFIENNGQRSLSHLDKTDSSLVAVISCHNKTINLEYVAHQSESTFDYSTNNCRILI